MRRRGFAMAVGVQDPPALHRSETCFGKPVGRGRLSQKLWPSPGKLFREARRASPQRQNNGAHACDGAGLPWLSRKLRPSPGKLFREARQASPQRRNNGARACDGAGLPWLSASKIPPLCIARKLVSGSPSGQPPAPKRRKRARGRLSQKLWPSPGTSAVARKVVSRSPTGQLPASKLRERARATRPLRGCRGSFGRRPERFLGKTPASKRRERAFGQPDGPDPSPNPRRFFASRKMARDAPGPGFCEP